jgi:hypothetical protein
MKHIITGLFLLVVISTQAQEVKNEMLPIGYSEAEFITWAKSIKKYSQSGFKHNLDANASRSWDKFYYLTDKLKANYKYVFNSDTVRWVDVTPWSFDAYKADIEKRCKKVDENTFMMHDRKVMITIDDKKKTVQVTRS